MRYRHSAGFGKRIEYYLIGLMLKEGLDCYVPLVDDDGIDVVIRRDDGSFLEVQIKASSVDVKIEDAAHFAAISHRPRDNYYFVFYSERLGADRWFIMSSEEFLSLCGTGKSGKNAGSHSIWLNGIQKDSITGRREPYLLARFEPYLHTDFSRFHLPQEKNKQ